MGVIEGPWGLDKSIEGWTGVEGNCEARQNYRGLQGGHPLNMYPISPCYDV